MAVSLLFTGVGFAATVPYAGIVAIEGLGIGNASYAIILTTGSLVGMLASVLLGWFSDRVGDRRLLVIACAAMAVLGQGLIWGVREQWAFVVTSCAIMPIGGALYSQTLAFARAYLASRGSGRVDFLITMIRAVYAVSWVIAPPLAGWVAATYTVFDPFLIAAVAFAICTLLFLWLLRDADTRPLPPHEHGAAPPPARGIAFHMLIGIVGVVALSTATRLNGLATPLSIVNHWGGTVADVGLYASLAALIEIPLMVAWGFAVRRVPLPAAIAIASLLFALYVHLAGQVNSVAELLWLQGLNALATAALMSLPISYLQEAIRGRVGLSTSLLDVVFVAASLISAGVFAVATGKGQYLAIYDFATLAGVIGAATMALAWWLGRHPQPAAATSR